MNASPHTTRSGLTLKSVVAAILFGSMSIAFAASDAVTLSGNEEAPL